MSKEFFDAADLSYDLWNDDELKIVGGFTVQKFNSFCTTIKCGVTVHVKNSLGMQQDV